VKGFWKIFGCQIFVGFLGSFWIGFLGSFCVLCCTYQGVICQINDTKYLKMQLNALYKLIFSLYFVISIDIPTEKIKPLFSLILLDIQPIFFAPLFPLPFVRLSFCLPSINESMHKD